MATIAEDFFFEIWKVRNWGLGFLYIFLKWVGWVSEENFGFFLLQIIRVGRLGFFEFLHHYKKLSD